MGRKREGSRSGEPPRSLDAGWPGWADPEATRRLREMVRGGQIAHAVLLSGQRGVGKARLARAFAQALCCTSPDSGDPSRPCGECRACRNVVRGAHPDVETVSLETQALLAEKPARGMNLGIDAIRGLRASAALLPLEATRRIVIVDDAETMLEPAQQALLKTLEEPPPFVTVLLLADDAEALLPTVRSRCRTVAVSPLPEHVVRQSLKEQGVSEELAGEVARLSRGSAAWTQDAVEDPTLLQGRREEWSTARAWVAAGRYERLATAFRLGEAYAKRRQETVGIVQATIQLLRLEMLRAAGADESARDDGAGIVQHNGSVVALGRAVAASLQCLRDLDANVRPKLALEAMVMAWPNQETVRT